ncbi:helix-turn-helix domain-containing protein [Paracoccus albus]|uniref:helix-turn-helix domain-containing protein n=1 Tax=Paracoccus albus TaxID=3017784 RepID=UPI0022F014B2|nr:helix-turn-helix domain-containing protein [Paracoccus albus]WBU59058.1 helix-turn-helix domain-containing protein [Paracoccus albus]
MKLLDIAEVAEASGVSASGLRYYEEQGLISSAGRHGLRRQYQSGVLLHLALINMGKSAGFSLTEIAGIFGKEGRPTLCRDDLHGKADDLERQMQEMRTLVAVLRHVAECPAPSHLDCPNFQRLMRVSTRAAKRRSKKNGGRKAPV